MLSKQIERTNLDVTKCYTQVKYVGGVETRTYVGKFVCVYCRGSGDGTTVHIEFDDQGKRINVDEEMWGRVGGYELSYFVEAEE